MAKQRLDMLLVERGLAGSRERAKRMIMAGEVLVDNQKVDKAGATVKAEAEIRLLGSDIPYVSRGGLKLAKAMQEFGVEITGKRCADIGASTGGFTDCMLQNGAVQVFAIDVGYGQLAWKLRTDERVVNIERTNLRYISEAEIPEPLDLAVMDVSFISIRLVLPAVQKLLKDGADLICLIKPQFEAGREAVGKKGVVRDPLVHKEVIRQILDFAASQSLHVEGLDYSPIKGPEGNIEYICHMKNSEGSAAAVDVDAVVAASHEAL